MKCDVCDEEFDTDNQLMQHKAQMHAGQSGAAAESGEGQIVDARENLMPRPEEQIDRENNDDDLEEPDFPKAANE
jgi:hypothetical protein